MLLRAVRSVLLTSVGDSYGYSDAAVSAGSSGYVTAIALSSYGSGNPFTSDGTPSIVRYSLWLSVCVSVCVCAWASRR